MLVQSLLQQAQTVTNTSKESLANISQLGNTNCFTVTTGHQLCLLPDRSTLFIGSFLPLI
ncbi:MAG: bacillithiol biosynthesis BshC [Sphingobacteriaceae bacterium]|nr:bacillithiol biosynthesis BshC [Sphingobacteriaceae bacterium]